MDDILLELCKQNASGYLSICDVWHRTDLSVRNEHMRLLALGEISISSGNPSEFLWSIILPYVPTSESA